MRRRKVITPMDFAIISVLIMLCLAILYLLAQSHKISRTLTKEPNFELLLANLCALQISEQQLDRSLRDEILRNRQDQVYQSQSLREEVAAVLQGLGNSLSAKADSLMRSNDQKLELLRGGVEQRLDSYSAESGRKIDSLTQSLAIATGNLQDDLSGKLVELRQENTTAFKNLGEGILATLTGLSQLQKNELQDLRTTVDGRLASIQSENDKKLEQMRQTVDEKLQGTLEARLGESFKQVSDRLEQVYKGLGEMQTLATGVGDLKRILTNVKTRGTWGEVQLGGLLEQTLAPGQYAQNVATTATGERVEYAIKLPGPRNDGTPVWLPIDAKFPVEDYQRLVEASERGDIEALDRASRQLESAIKFCAKTLSEKYIAPPCTTDFGILFLATEGLYAEAMRRPGLSEYIQRDYRVVLAGPSTLSALLNSLQMGFRTLAIQQRSSEVWEVLGAVKSEFGKYADVLAKIKKKLNDAQSTVEKAESRTRVIQRKLRDVEATENHTLTAGTESNDVFPSELDEVFSGVEEDG